MPLASCLLLQNSATPRQCTLPERLHFQTGRHPNAVLVTSPKLPSHLFWRSIPPLKPTVYAKLLLKTDRSRHTGLAPQHWLVRRCFGVGKRIAPPSDPGDISAVLSGALDRVETHTHPISGWKFPTRFGGASGGSKSRAFMERSNRLPGRSNQLAQKIAENSRST